MKVQVRCARGVQVAYVTLHHRGCTLVPPSTWAKRVRRASMRGPFCAPSTGRSPPAPAPHSCAASHAVLVPRGLRVALATRPFSAVPFCCCGVSFAFFFAALFFRVVPSSLHARTTTLHRHLSRFRSVLTSCPTAILWRGPWRSPAMPGGRPSLATSIFFLSSPPSPPLCLPPALLVLFSCSVCSPLVVPTPWLYLTRFHTPQGIRPVFRPVG